jgi:hypothetical protein
MTEAGGEPKIVLDGWGYNDTHETLNTFTGGRMAGSTDATECSRTAMWASRARRMRSA